MIDMIERQVNASDYTAMDIAAAFLKQALGQVNLDNGSDADYDFDNTGAEEGMVRLFINIGKKTASSRETFSGRSPGSPACQASWSARSICMTSIPSWKCRESMAERSPRGNEEHQDQRALC